MSNLSEISNESTYFTNKVGYQRRALLRKTATLQSRQKCQNICQMLTPILGLMVIVVIRSLGSADLQHFADKVIYIPLPFMFNLDYTSIA